MFYYLSLSLFMLQCTRKLRIIVFTIFLLWFVCDTKSNYDVLRGDTTLWCNVKEGEREKFRDNVGDIQEATTGEVPHVRKIENKKNRRIKKNNKNREGEREIDKGFKVIVDIFWWTLRWEFLILFTFCALFISHTWK